MGRYALVGDIESEFKDITFGSTTSFSPGEVDAFITQAEAVLHGELATVYTVPVTGTEAKNIMKQIVILRVKGRLLNNLHVKTGSDDEDQGTTAQSLLDQAQSLVDKIVGKQLALPGMSYKAGSANVGSYTGDNNLSHTFRRGVDQW